MALVKCSECGKDISNQAKICPNCGGNNTNIYKPKTDSTLKYAAIMCVVFVVVIIFHALLKNNFNADDVSTTTNQMAKSPQTNGQTTNNSSQEIFSDINQNYVQSNTSNIQKANNTLPTTTNFPDKQQSVSNTEALSSDQQNKTDTDSLIAFDKKLKEIINDIDYSDSMYANKAGKANNYLELYDVAKWLKARSEIAKDNSENLTKPSFSNQDLQNAVDDASNNVRYYIAYSIEIAEKLMDVANKGDAGEGVPALMDEIKTYTALKQSELTKFLDNINKAYSILGYNEKELDIENGGFVPKAEMEHISKKLKEQPTKDGQPEVLGVYEDKDEIFWAVVVIKPGLGKDDIISIAKQLHSQNQEMNYAILDEKPTDFELWKKFKHNDKLNHDIKNKLAVWTTKHEIASIDFVFKTDSKGAVDIDVDIDMAGKWKLLPYGQYAKSIRLEKVDL